MKVCLHKVEGQAETLPTWLMCEDIILRCDKLIERLLCEFWRGYILIGSNLFFAAEMVIS